MTDEENEKIWMDGFSAGADMMSDILAAVLYSLGGSVEVPRGVFGQITPDLEIEATGDDYGDITYTLVRKSDAPDES